MGPEKVLDHFSLTLVPRAVRRKWICTRQLCVDGQDASISSVTWKARLPDKGGGPPGWRGAAKAGHRCGGMEGTGQESNYRWVVTAGTEDLLLMNSFCDEL